LNSKLIFLKINVFDASSSSLCSPCWPGICGSLPQSSKVLWWQVWVTMPGPNYFFFWHFPFTIIVRKDPHKILSKIELNISGAFILLWGEHLLGIWYIVCHILFQ
jgi:hypothetical protein